MLKAFHPCENRASAVPYHFLRNTGYAHEFAGLCRIHDFYSLDFKRLSHIAPLTMHHAVLMPCPVVQRCRPFERKVYAIPFDPVISIVSAGILRIG